VTAGGAARRQARTIPGVGRGDLHWRLRMRAIVAGAAARRWLRRVFPAVARACAGYGYPSTGSAAVTGDLHPPGAPPAPAPPPPPPRPEGEA
jgi:hypothetical protein